MSTLLQSFAHAMGSVGAGVEARFEGERLAWVLGVEVGTFDSEDPLIFIDENGREREWRYHYDDPPEWAGSDFADRFYSNVHYLTLAEDGVWYESRAPEEARFPDGKRWFRVRSYSGSGETGCPCGSSGCGESVGAGCTEGMLRCPMCEAEAGGEHGHIYVGSTVETVYKHVDVECDECGLTADDCRVDDGSYIECDCQDFYSDG